MRNYTLTLISLALGLGLSGQSISPVSICSAKHAASNGGICLSWTAGQIFDITRNGGTLTLTEGFLQPEGDCGVVDVVEADRNTNVPKLYPNPAWMETKLQFSAPLLEPVLLQVYDITGNRLFHFNLLKGDVEYELHLFKWPHGMYFLILSSLDGELYGNLKLIKSKS